MRHAGIFVFVKPIYYSSGEYGLSSLATEAMRMHNEEEGFVPTSFFARVKALLAKAKKLEQEQNELLKSIVRETKKKKDEEAAQS